GKIDGQTIYGKTPVGVAKAAKQHRANVIALCGTLGRDYEKVYAHGIDAVFSIAEGPGSLADALQNGARYLEALARNVAQRSEEHTSELQSRFDLVCRLLLEKKK